VTHPFEDEIVQRCVRLAKLCRNAGDAVYVMKMLAVAMAAQVDGVRQDGASQEAAAGSLLLSTTAVCAVELDCDRDQISETIGNAMDTVLAKMRESTLVTAPGGVA
jgi:hypothetical protein